MKAAQAIAVFLEPLSVDDRGMVDALRVLILSADDRLEQDFKWNAPSFRLGAEHRVTLGLVRHGGVRLVLHRGVARKDTSDFRFDDPDNLAAWPDKDRGVIVFQSLEEIELRREQLRSLMARWLQLPSD